MPSLFSYQVYTVLLDHLGKGSDELELLDLLADNVVRILACRADLL